MIFKIIHETFEIDLLDTDVDLTERNFWFENGFQIKYSLPFTTTLTDDLDQKLGMISHPNSLNGIRYVEVKLYKYNRSYDAKLFIERLQNRDLTASIEYGFDELPNFSKKLPELPLQQFDIAEASLQAHALGIIGQTYPDVNYNFQKTKVTDDVIDTSTEKWSFFEKYLNNYDGSAFLTNTFDVANNQPENRNIMQPMPYILHVLAKGFEDAGYTLQGDILQDPEYTHTLVNVLSKYYTNVITTSQVWQVTQDMYQNLIGVDFYNATFPGPHFFGYYEETIPVTEAGLYKILGNAFVRRDKTRDFVKISFISQSGFENVIYFYDGPFTSASYVEEFLDIDISLQVIDQNLPGTLKFVSENLHEATIGGNTFNDLTILDVSVSKVAEFNNNELVYQALLQPNEINLPKCVPDITFGEFVKALMSHRNYDIDVQQDTVTMNKVNNKILEPATLSLEQQEVKYPEIEFLEQKSYLLKFQSQPDGFDYTPVHVTNNSLYYSEERINDNTETIQINLLPLQIDQENQINTAILHTDDTNKLLISLYDGTISSDNLSQSNLPLLLPHSYDNYYKNWLRFIILAKIFTWSNVLPIEEAFDIDVYKNIFAYNLKLTLKEVIIRTLNRNYCSVEFKAYSSF